MFDPDTSFFDTGLALSPHDRKSLSKPADAQKRGILHKHQAKK
jgi:hypothetical protein